MGTAWAPGSERNILGTWTAGEMPTVPGCDVIHGVFCTVLLSCYNRMVLTDDAEKDPHC